MLLIINSVAFNNFYGSCNGRGIRNLLTTNELKVQQLTILT